MSVSLKQSREESNFHYSECTRSIGPRNGVIEFTVNYRRNGKTKYWKREPKRFRIPVKYGMYDYVYITEFNQHVFHCESECPLEDKRYVTGKR